MYEMCNDYCNNDIFENYNVLAPFSIADALGTPLNSLIIVFHTCKFFQLIRIMSRCLVNPTPNMMFRSPQKQKANL